VCLSTNCFVTAAEEDSDDDAANAMGELSIDSNSQVCFYDTRTDVSGTNRKFKVRFHGGSSGLKLLMQTQRDDDTGAGGLWSVILLILRITSNTRAGDCKIPSLALNHTTKIRTSTCHRLESKSTSSSSFSLTFTPHSRLSTESNFGVTFAARKYI
jgi:hypothetical protein